MFCAITFCSWQDKRFVDHFVADERTRLIRVKNELKKTRHLKRNFIFFIEFFPIASFRQWLYLEVDFWPEFEVYDTSEYVVVFILNVWFFVLLNIKFMCCWWVNKRSALFILSLTVAVFVIIVIRVSNIRKI